MKIATLLAAFLIVGVAEIGTAFACSIPAGDPASRSILDDDTPDCFDVEGGQVFLSVSNACTYAVTLEPLDCAGCQSETTFEPDTVADYEVPSTSEPNTIGWSSEQGSGTISYVGSNREEPPEVSCGDTDSACSSTAARPGESPLLAVIIALGALVGLSRRRRP